MIVYSFQKLVMEPYEAFDVVSAGTVNFSKQKFCSWCHYSVRNAELVYLCGTHRQDGMNAQLSRGKHEGYPLFEKLYPESHVRHLLELHVFQSNIYLLPTELEVRTRFKVGTHEWTSPCNNSRGQVPSGELDIFASKFSRRPTLVNCSWNQSLRPAPSCKLFRGLVAGTGRLVCADLYGKQEESI